MHPSHEADVASNPAPDTDPERRVGIEFRKFYHKRLASGFVARYLSGARVLDIGFKGGDESAVPITDRAVGVGLDYPGYDGTRLPFDDGSQDALLASHVLEHIWNFREVLADWYRVLRVGGFLVIFVPHRYLYERRVDLPSHWNGDHKRFYTPASLLAEIESSLPINGFRVRHLIDNDEGFDYGRDPADVPAGGYEIELVIEKIAPVAYLDELEYPPHVRQIVAAVDALVFRTVAQLVQSAGGGALDLELIPSLTYITPWARLCQIFCWEGAPELGGRPVAEPALRDALTPLLLRVQVDEDYYLDAYPELRTAVAEGRVGSPATHWRTYGYFEGRLHRDRRGTPTP